MKSETPPPPGRKNRETAYIIHPETYDTARKGRSLDDILEEAEGLALAIDLDVLKIRAFRVPQIQASAFLGKGQRDMAREDIEEIKPDIVIVNHTLSPVQQRNLEKEWNAKVIDRTGLILEIFGARAQTKEGRLQVDLAALEYQRSRIVRSWTHLERQRGGGGFMGGPGERQLELDRRMIDDKILRLKRQLEDVRRTRGLARKSRERVPFPVVALVGYTNAGKSTLFNRLTGAKVLAADLLFATLDPTMRRIELPNGQVVILSDTVGFISDLPTHLVAAFRATLEQATSADVIVHVMDVSRPDYREQREDVIKILGDLGIDYEQDRRVIELWNKTDLLQGERLEEISRGARFASRAVPVSALTGTGIDGFLSRVAGMVSENRSNLRFKIPVEDGRALSWLYGHAQIIKRRDGEKSITLDVMMDSKALGQFRSGYGYAPEKPRKTRKKK